MALVNQYRIKGDGYWLGENFEKVRTKGQAATYSTLEDVDAIILLAGAENIQYQVELDKIITSD
jgi:hypothetical protein